MDGFFWSVVSDDKDNGSYHLQYVNNHGFHETFVALYRCGGKFFYFIMEAGRQTDSVELQSTTVDEAKREVLTEVRYIYRKKMDKLAQRYRAYNRIIGSLSAVLRFNSKEENKVGGEEASV